MFALRTCFSKNVQGLCLRTGRNLTSKFEGLVLLSEFQLLKIRNYSGKTDGTRTATLAHHIFQRPTHDVAGEKPPIVILHGLLGSKGNWRYIAKELLSKTKERRIVTVDLRNHGDSVHSDIFTYELMATDLVRLFHDLKIKSATLMGHSLGGRVCMLTAMLNPALVDNLIVVDISPIGQSPNMMGLVKVLEALKNLNLDPSLSAAQARIVAVPQLQESIKDMDLIRFLLLSLVDSQGEAKWRWKFNLDALIDNFHLQICRFPALEGMYNKPTLFIAGEKSDYIKVEHEPAIEKIFPSVQFVYIQDARHWVHADKPKEFLAVVLDFINANDL